MRGFGGWAWAVGIGLIASDIALPIPSSAVMAALGIIYGPWIGGAISAGGSILAGLTGYGVCRMIGPATAEKLAEFTPDMLLQSVMKSTGLSDFGDDSFREPLDLLLQDFRLNPKRYVNVSVFGKKQKDYTVPENDPAMLQDSTGNN